MTPALLGAVRALADDADPRIATLARALMEKAQPPIRRLGIRDLMARLGIEATTTIARMVARGDLPEPDRLPGGRRVWRLDVIETWERTRAAAPRQAPRGIAAVKAAARAAREAGRG